MEKRSVSIDSARGTSAESAVTLNSGGQSSSMSGASVSDPDAPHLQATARAFCRATWPSCRGEHFGQTGADGREEKMTVPTASY